MKRGQLVAVSDIVRMFNIGELHANDVFSFEDKFEEVTNGKI